MGILSEILSSVGKRKQIARATAARADLEGSHGTGIGEPTSEGPVGEQMHDSLQQQQEPVQHGGEPEREVTVVAEIGEATNEGSVGEQMHDPLQQQQQPVQNSVERESEVTVVAEIGEPTNEGPVGEQMHDLLTQQQEPVQQGVEPESEVTVVSQTDEPNKTLETTQTEGQTNELPPVDAAPARRSTPSPDINDPQPWHDRAEEARAQAENMYSVFKKTMLTVAAHYELLAKRAERRRDPSR